METKYWTVNSYKTIEFTKEFYNLGLKAKYKLLVKLPEEVLSNAQSHERIVQAIIQHSSNERKKELPCQRERKLSKEARQQDEQELEPTTTDLSEIFNIVVANYGE